MGGLVREHVIQAHGTEHPRADLDAAFSDDEATQRALEAGIDQDGDLAESWNRPQRGEARQQPAGTA